jgi:hypothetical protein
MRLPCLAAQGVLAYFWAKLSDPTAQCVFVSTDKAFQLELLAEGSRGAASWEEFQDVFLHAKSRSDAFEDLCRRLDMSCGEAVYDALKRIRIETVGEDFLHSTVESRVATLVEGDSATVIDVLAQWALDNVHHELIAYDIWHHVESRGFRRRQWGQDRNVLAAVCTANARYLTPLREYSTIHLTRIPRDEVQTVLNMLTSHKERRGVLLAGEAGVGKSGVILQVVEALQEQGVPVIAFRIDRLEPTPLPNNVGEQLGLPGSPVNVLAAIAQGRECVLIMDQLDAVSLASGRHPDFFECVHEMLHQVQAHPHMRLLVACRTFDLENDHRLRQLTGQNGLVHIVTINRLSHTTVRDSVNALGLDAQRLSNKQLELVSIPLHLSLLAEIAADRTVDVLNFSTAKELYERYWDRKQSVLRIRLGRAVQWTPVVDTLGQYMSERQMLSAPLSIVDAYAEDAAAMVSEHVLMRDGQRYAFFHEGFFDYAFARRFAAQGQALIPFLQQSEQHLFRRAQVRQILLHERDTDRTQYLNDLPTLITHSGIRFHLKQVMFAVLRDLTDPTVEEWNILAPLLDREPADSYAVAVWRMLHGAVPWLQLLDRLGVIEAWLAGQDAERVDRVISLLSSMQKKLPDRVAAFIEPYVGTSEEWRHRLVYLSQWADLGAGRGFLDLFLRLLDEGILDEARGPIAVNSDFWSLVYGLPETHPDWACEVIGHYLNRRFRLSMDAGQCNPFHRSAGTIRDSQLDDEVFLESARRAPHAFVTQVLPFMLRVMNVTAQRAGEPPWIDPVWHYRSYGKGYGIAHALLSAMETALSELALHDPDTFAIIAAPLRSLDFETIQYLLIRAYAANGSRFAEDGAEYLCERSLRLPTGYVDNAYWAMRQLLEAITPHCSDAHLARLGRMILAYYPDSERSTQGRHARGHAQLVLLEGITASRRSLAVTRRLAEWQRKFGIHAVEPPQPLQGGVVESPIPASAANKMTDDQWLRAMARYSQDSWSSLQVGTLRGGADALAQVLEQHVAQEPVRFAALVHQFPDTTHLSYFQAVLRGLTDTNLDAEIVLRVCQRCHQLPHRLCGKEIVRLLASLAKVPLPKDALDIVAWYATEDPHPGSDQESWGTRTPEGDRSRDILTVAINSVRGSAAEVIRDLIWHDEQRLAYLLPTIDRASRGMTHRSAAPEGSLRTP